MKKLLIALAAVAVAAGVQAATVSWGSGTIYTPGEAGAFTTTKAAANSVTYYLWTMDATTYASTTLDSIVKLDTASATATGKNNALGGTVSYKDTTSYGAGDSIYWGILFTYTDGDSKEWYIANMGTGSVNDLGGALTFGGLATTSSTFATVSGWTSAAPAPGPGPEPVPEPTSGLLMLIGAAGLALRRKRA